MQKIGLIVAALSAAPFASASFLESFYMTLGYESELTDNSNSAVSAFNAGTDGVTFSPPSSSFNEIVLTSTATGYESYGMFSFGLGYRFNPIVIYGELKGGSAGISYQFEYEKTGYFAEPGIQTEAGYVEASTFAAIAGIGYEFKPFGQEKGWYVRPFAEATSISMSTDGYDSYDTPSVEAEQGGVSIGVTFGYSKPTFLGPIGFSGTTEQGHSAFQSGLNTTKTSLDIELPGIASILVLAGAGAYSASKSYAWDQLYNAFGIAIWRCRDETTGRFVGNAYCRGKAKIDSTWPGL